MGMGGDRGSTVCKLIFPDAEIFLFPIRSRHTPYPKIPSRRIAIAPITYYYLPLAVREAPPEKYPCCQPDSGKTAVRDERGAYGNVGYGGIRNPRRNRKSACR